ncbi:transcriptional regulator [Paraburkholderia sp. SIMBA_055]
MTTTKIPLDLSQQDFLRFAMKQLGMGRDDFARRVSLARHTLDRLLLPSESSEFRSLPETGWSDIGEILKRDEKS